MTTTTQVNQPSRRGRPPNPTGQQPKKPRRTAEVLNLQQIKQRRGTKNTARDGLPSDTGYRFSDYDPVLEEVRAAIRNCDLTVGEIIEKVLDMSANAVHLSHATIEHWLDGKTRRPQNFTLSWVLYAIGIERPLVRTGENRSYTQWMIEELTAAGYTIAAP